MFSLRSLLVGLSLVPLCVSVGTAEDVPSTITPVGDDLAVETDIANLEFSADSKTLLIGAGGVVWLSDVPQLRLRGPGIQGPSATTGLDRPPNDQPVIGKGYMAAEAAKFSKDGKTLFVTTFQTLQRWDVAQGTAVGKAVKLPGLIQSGGTAINPATGDLFLVSRWALFDRGPMGETPTPVIGVAMNPTTGRKVGKPLRFDQRPWPGERNQWALSQVLYSPDGKLLAVRHFNGATRLWDVAGGKDLVPDGLSDTAEDCHIQWSPDGKRLLIHNEKGAQLWDPLALKPVGELLATAGAEGGNSSLLVYRSSFSPDSATLAITAFTGRGRGQDVQLVDTATGKSEGRIKTSGTGRGYQVTHLQYAANALVVITDSRETIVPWLWDPATGKPLAQPTESAYMHRAAVSPDGKHLATYYYKGGARTLRMWHLPQGA